MGCFILRLFYSLILETSALVIFASAFRFSIFVVFSMLSLVWEYMIDAVSDACPQRPLEHAHNPRSTKNGTMG